MLDDYNVKKTDKIYELPFSYLLIQFNSQMTISQVQQGIINPLASSPISQTLILNIVKGLVEKQDTKLLQSSMQNIINTAFQTGDSFKADLLIEDIFGVDNCGIIGLPGKWRAASLGKPGSNYWDQASSLLISLAINTGLMAQEWIILTKVNKIVMKTAFCWHSRMLSMIRAILDPTVQLLPQLINEQATSVIPKQIQTQK